MKTKINLFVTLLLTAFVVLGFYSCMEEDMDWSRKDALLEPIALIYEVREIHPGKGSKDVAFKADLLNGLTKTTGVVISDVSGNNMPKNQMIIQSTDPKSLLPTTNRTLALILELDNAAENIYVHGDSVIVDLEGTVLKNTDGNLILSGVNLDKIMKVKSGVRVDPLTVTVTDLYVDFNKYTNMLIKVDAPFDEVYKAGEVLKGTKNLYAGKDSLVYVRTEENAEFANKDISNKGSAEFTGITYWNGNDREMRMRTTADIQYEAGPVYEGWPENFEYPSIKTLGLVDEGGVIPKSMTSYNNADNFGFFRTGKWMLYFCILVDPELSATQGRDRVSGEQGIRIQQKMKDQKDNMYYGDKAVLEMKFDMPQGASKVTYTYGSYYNDAKSTFVLEYSTDQGATWQEANTPISKPEKYIQVHTTMLDIKKPVRFRINKGLNKSVDGRLSIDNIYIYKGVW